jgi:hypothetical protein
VWCEHGTIYNTAVYAVCIQVNDLSVEGRTGRILTDSVGRFLGYGCGLPMQYRSARISL